MKPPGRYSSYIGCCRVDLMRAVGSEGLLQSGIRHPTRSTALRRLKADYYHERNFKTTTLFATLSMRLLQCLTRILEQDLPLQYEKPQDLSCFCDTIEFEDPVTSLRGKLLYRGMLCE